MQLYIVIKTPPFIKGVLGGGFPTWSISCDMAIYRYISPHWLVESSHLVLTIYRYPLARFIHHLQPTLT